MDSLCFLIARRSIFYFTTSQSECFKVCLNCQFSCLNRASCITLYQFFAFQDWFLTLQEVFLWLIVRLCLKVPFSCLKLHCVIKIWRIIHFKQVFVHLRQHSFFLCLNSDTIEGSFFIEWKTKSDFFQYRVRILSFFYHFYCIILS